MIVSHKFKCVFVHIQKTGGTSIEATLANLDPSIRSTKVHHHQNPDRILQGPHRLAKEIREYLGEHVWNSYFKFAIVRNPWDRLTSWYNMGMVLANPETVPHNLWKYALTHSRNFEEFVKNCTDVIMEKHGEQRSFAFNQLDYLIDEQGQIIVDYVGRFETLNKSFEEITIKIGIPKVKFLWKRRMRHAHYSTYYTEETRRIIANRFQRDIDMFRYEFEKSSSFANHVNDVFLRTDRVMQGADLHWRQMKTSMKDRFPGFMPYYKCYKKFFNARS